MEQFLFGYLDQPYDTPINYLILHLKKFIWIKKFKPTKSLNLVGFKNYFNKIIKDLKNIYDEIENSAAFQVWSDLIDLLPANPD